MPNLKVTKAEAENQLRKIPHSTVQNSITEYWIVKNGHVEAKSVCWLYCWGVTERRSKNTVKAAREAFDAILDVPLGNFKPEFHRWAQEERYSDNCDEKQLEKYIKR